MTATVLINNRSFLARLGLFKNRIAGNINRALDVTAQVATKRIEERAKTGKDVNNSAFKPYTPEYEEYKKKLQGSAFGGVNLQVTNDMFNSLTNTKPVNGKTTIFFAGKTNAKKAEGNQRIRNFFGLNRKDEQELRKVFSREVFK
jgi:hypothetical protein